MRTVLTIMCTILLSTTLFAQSINNDLTVVASSDPSGMIIVHGFDNYTDDSSPVVDLKKEELLQPSLGEAIIFNSDGETSPYILIESDGVVEMGLFSKEGELISNKKLRKRVGEIRFIGLEKGEYILVLQDQQSGSRNKVNLVMQ